MTSCKSLRSYPAKYLGGLGGDGVSGSHQAIADSELDVGVRGGLITGKMVPTFSSYTGGGLNRGAIAAVPPALDLKPHNSVFLCMSLVPPEFLSLCQSPNECL